MGSHVPNEATTCLVVADWLVNQSGLLSGASADQRELASAVVRCLRDRVVRQPGYASSAMDFKGFPEFPDLESRFGVVEGYKELEIETFLARGFDPAAW